MQQASYKDGQEMETIKEDYGQRKKSGKSHFQTASMHGKGIHSSIQHAPTVTMCNGEENQREQDEALHDPGLHNVTRYYPTFNNKTTSGQCLDQHINADDQMVNGNASLDSSTSQEIAAAAVRDGQKMMNTKGQSKRLNREVHAPKQPTTVINSKSSFGEGDL
ncbi:hypothetical protein L2E82_30513 [Cichorium intybus]|uniref:Uncharacterized protein n=1 Tax=Cichorium intybus TaxID=13427 RepID=A0ACB9D0S7_CICIN|nr:hypothetical protein L2E82_30513 [Cichorium intybus]